jgi:hypothetical protein
MTPIHELDCQGLDIPRDDLSSNDAQQQPPMEAQAQHTTPPTVFDDIDLDRPVLPDDGTSPCLGEVLYYMFEWVARNKSTDKAAASAWSMLAEVLPPTNFPQQYAFVKGILERYVKGKVKTIDLCPNGHIAYFDCTAAPLREFRHADKQKCPQCGVSRYVTVKTRYGKKKKKARAKMYYLGIGRYFQDMFRQPDIAVKLDYNHGGKHRGSIKKSRGFHEKVWSNPVMAADGRNQAVIATADGVPLFKDMTARKGHPFMLRTANGGEHLQKDLYKAHLFGYIPCETWDVAADGTAERLVGAPASLQPMMTVFADEMYRLYDEGMMIEDFSRPKSDPNRWFLMRVVLLLMIGDYPGLGEITDMKSGIPSHINLPVRNFIHVNFMPASCQHNTYLGNI